jgi:hypothetical protein
MTKGSLLKLLFIGFCTTILPFILLCGIASAFGAHTVFVNRKPVTGTEGLIVSLVLGPLACTLFTAFAWVGFAIGLWIYSKFSPIELEFVDAEVISSQSSGETEPSQPGEPETL